jgi:PAS domain S-box-containing protein
MGAIRVAASGRGDKGRRAEDVPGSRRQESRCTDAAEAGETGTGSERFEALLTDLSLKFVNLPGHEVDREIEDAQRRICECLGMDVSAFWEWSDQGQDEFALTHIYRPPDIPAPPQRMDAREYFPWAREEILAGRTVSISSVDDLPLEAARDKQTLQQFGIKSNCVIPLSTGAGRPLGAVSFNTTRAERRWSQALVKRLCLIGQVFANAIARKRADESLRESEERLNLAVEAAGAGLWVVEPDGSSVWASPTTRELFQFSPDAPLKYRDFLRRIHPEDRAEVGRSVADSIQTGQPHALEFRLVLPRSPTRWITARGRLQAGARGPRRLMGVLVDTTYRKQAEQVRRAHDRMQREFEIAHRVQQGLLPREPLSIPGYSVAGWSEPATEAGGDYYDWLILPDGEAVVVIADATGHGIGPALMVTVCRAYFRAAAQVDTSIEGMVAHVNDLILPDLQPGSFVTAAIAALDFERDLLHVYSAGHGPILFYRASQARAVFWDSDVVPLGLFTPMIVGPSRGLALEPGDMLVLTTDGFFEWADPDGLEYGTERLRRFLEQHAGLEPHSFIQALREDVRAFVRGTPQMDDLTAVIIRRELP